MGLFSRKRKLTKEQRKELEKAKEILQNTKDLQKRHDKEELERSRGENPKANQKPRAFWDEHPEEYKKLMNQIEQYHNEQENQSQIKQEKLNKPSRVLSKKHKKKKSTTIKQKPQICNVENCSKEVDFFTGKKNCRYCDKPHCFDHAQPENHNCVTVNTKYLRKTWLRKYGVNITSGKYIVVCDDCGFVSEYATFIGIAGDERNHHIENSSCNPKKVWLEEVVGEIKIPKDVDWHLEIPTDRTFWVCAHCRPPQKFTDRAEYISHHYLHS